MGKSKRIERYVGDRSGEVDRDGISIENHMQMFNRLVAAGLQGIHGKPGDRKPKGK